ncbi:TPA: TIGR03752 family integrating conjugative element protein, partial [Legionella pneumophila]|nr:TIGR03752 family integrating conjugative element protein [Legionella pneumophila]
MNKNNGIKILAGSVVFAVIMILINSRHSSPASDNTPNPNNFGEAIASQFNDNIRDVSARLLETEKKLEQMHKENKSLQKQLKQPKQEVGFALQDELNALKEKFASLTEHQTQSYPMEGNQAPVSGQIKDLDTLLDKAPSESKIFTEHDNSTKEEAPTKTPFYTIPAGSDFSKVTLLSALIGEVPVEGKLMQPLFPFTAIVSRGDLMTANGIQLPEEITGMKISGYSIGV